MPKVEAATRPPLVLVPGLLNDAELWRDQIAMLSDRVSCIVPDITRGETLESLALGVLAESGPRFALAGFSFGGYVCQEVARLAPERVAGLALLDTAITADTPERAEARRTVNRAARLPGKFHGFGANLFETYLDRSHFGDERILGRIRSMAERLGPEVFIRQNNIERKDGAEVLRRLTCPVLIVCGESDALTPLAAHQAMLAHAPHAKLVVIPQSGHMTPIENPDAVTAALLAWLECIEWPRRDVVPSVG